MKQAFLFAALLAVVPAVACHSKGGAPGPTGGAGTTSGNGAGTSGNGAGDMGGGGSCEGTTPASTCSATAPCASGMMCVEDMDLTTCGLYGSCEPLTSGCSAAPTCDCLMNDPMMPVVECSGDATHGFVVVYNYGESSCCP